MNLPGNQPRTFFGSLQPHVPILHRYITRELLIVAALAITVLTSLLALCGLLKPLRQHAVSTTEILQILILLFPVFLAFTIPFALMLACCWVYGRLAADNELWACSSSGINIQTLLVVPLALGLLGMVLNIALVNWVVPNWALYRFEKVLARHGKDIVYRELTRRGSFELSRQHIGRRCVIHADNIDRNHDVLYGVGVAVFAKDDRTVERAITAEVADLDFSWSNISALPDSIAVIPRRATVVELPGYDTYKAAMLVFSGRIKETIRQRFQAMSLGNLQAMRANPELYNTIRDSAQEARRIYIAYLLVKQLYADLADHGFFQLYGQERMYRFKGQPSEATFGQDGAGGFLAHATIEEFDRNGQGVGRAFLDVDSLSLELVELPSARELTALVVLHNARITTPGPSGRVEELERTRFSIGPLNISQDIVQQGLGLPLEKIRSVDFPKPVPIKLEQLGRQIKDQQTLLNKELVLEIHTRFALASCCPVLAVLGGLLGAIFRKGQFLAAVGLCLWPALMAVLFIFMGQRMADTQAFSTSTAVGVTWTSLVLLSAVNLLLGLRVLRR